MITWRAALAALATMAIGTVFWGWLANWQNTTMTGFYVASTVLAVVCLVVFFAVAWWETGRRA